MITSKLIPGGGYGDCLPSGQYAAPISATSLDTSEGLISTTFDPRYLRLSPNGKAWAAQCGNQFGGVEYLLADKTWLKIDGDVGGINPVIYDYENLLHVHPVGPGLPVEGYRYVDADNRLIESIDTQAPGPIATRLTQWTDLSRNGQTLFVGQGDKGGVAVFDGTTYRYLTDPAHTDYLPAEAFVVGIRGWILDGRLAFFVHLPMGASRAVCVWMDVADVATLPLYPDVLVEEPIGPRSEPLAKDTPVNVAPFFAYDARCWPRGKKPTDTHGMDMQVLPSDDAETEYRIWLAKFDVDGQGKCGELLSVDKALNGWIHLRADASAALHPTKPYVDTWTDTRWLRKAMRIGETLTIKCERVWFHPVSGLELGRENYTKRMAVLNVWDRYYCGPDFGICRVMEYGYNVERYRVAIAADGRVVGWGDWDYNDGTSTAYSRFWLLGGQRFPVRLPNCQMPRAILEENPVPVPMPTDAVAIVTRYAMAFPPPWGTPGQAHEDTCRAWMRRLAETLCALLGPSWGHKSTSAGSPPSKDLLGRQVDGRFDGWDILTGAGTGMPVLTDPPRPVDVTGQFFIPVPAANHLGGIAVPTGRPALPTPWISASSFDLGTRLSLGDRRWLDYLKAEDVRNPRVMPLRKVADSDTVAGCLARIPLLLGTLAEYQRKAEFVLLADTERHGMTEESALQWVRDCIARIEAQPDGIGAIQGANEPEHSTQQPFVRNAAFMAKVEALVPKRWPYSHGSSTNGGESDGASYLTIHGARNQSASDNAKVAVQLSKDTGLPVFDDESIGVGPVNKPGSRTNDPDYGRQLADAARVNNLPGATLHLEAGLTCNMDTISGPERGAVTGFVKRMKEGSGEPPPPNGHPILDALMSPEYPVGYTFWVTNRAAVTTEIIAWYQRAHSRPPAESDIAHGLWRVINECDRWKKMRTALENTWPGGAPT